MAKNLLSKVKVSYPKKGWAQWRELEGVGFKFMIPLDQSNRIRRNINRYANIDQLRTALYYQTERGRALNNIKAIEVFSEKVIQQLGVSEREGKALQRAFESLSDEEKNRFWEINENLMKQVYNFYSDYIDDPHTARFGMKLSVENKSNAPQWVEQVGAKGDRAKGEITDRLWESMAQLGRYRDDFI